MPRVKAAAELGRGEETTAQARSIGEVTSMQWCVLPTLARAVETSVPPGRHEGFQPEANPARSSQLAERGPLSLLRAGGLPDG
mmetsp:Transcript_25187/g.65815  ORF Transcript_25187/g.65815 Transcript_25187/m.65815 type:complete len:83 (-) Transcript_25187:492-740(-)